MNVHQKFEKYKQATGLAALDLPISVDNLLENAFMAGIAVAASSKNTEEDRASLREQIRAHAKNKVDLEKGVWDGVAVWKPFHFESNQYFGTIAGPQDWLRLRGAYPMMDDNELLGAREATYRGTRTLADRDQRPNYGLRSEHDGDRTLKDFFADNNMLGLLPPR